ncbi:MAG: nucleoside triphosphate pyrophosphohydrolase [Candidatus Saccharimonadales bacterium]
MRTFYFGKVIRDKILDAMQDEGCEVKYRVLEGAERQAKLTEKLNEESQEISAASDQDDFLEELADVQLVIDALVEGLRSDDRAKFVELHEAKLRKKGGFVQSIWIEQVSVPNDSPWIEYFETKPDKYPEIK